MRDTGYRAIISNANDEEQTIELHRECIAVDCHDCPYFEGDSRCGTTPCPDSDETIYRWYSEDEEDSETSGETIDEAIDAAMRGWPGCVICCPDGSPY